MDEDQLENQSLIALSHPRVLMEMYNEIQLVFMPAHTISIFQSMDQRVISIFESCSLKNTFYKATASIAIPLVDLCKVN